MQKKIRAVPAIVYPESDGEPMAETDKHRKLMMDFIFMLEGHFRYENDVYVSGNLLLYYVEGDPRKCLSPDVFVTFGVEKKERRTFLTWAEPNTPDFVLEVASPNTISNDLGKKKELYASVLRVKEYFIYDPLGQIVPSFIGYRLVDGIYREISHLNERIPSETLGLQLGENEGELRLYDPNRLQWLQPPQERVDAAEARTQQEIQARQTAEEELEKALAEIERLRAQT